MNFKIRFKIFLIYNVKLYKKNFYNKKYAMMINVKNYLSKVYFYYFRIKR